MQSRHKRNKSNDVEISERPKFNRIHNKNKTKGSVRKKSQIVKRKSTKTERKNNLLKGMKSKIIAIINKKWKKWKEVNMVVIKHQYRTCNSR